MDRNAKTYAEEGYRLNVIVFRCVDILATKMAAIPLEVTINGEAVPDHPLAKILAQPNPSQAGADFWRDFAAFRLISGNSYVEALRDKSPAALPTELWNWAPYEMRIAAPDRGFIPLGYAWDGAASGNPDASRAWDVDRVTGACDLGHWKTFHPTNRWYGMSPLDPAARSVDEHNAATAWNTNLLQNNATPSGVLATKGTLTDKQYARLKDQIEQRMAGPENARRPLLLEGDMSWIQAALSPTDMDWLAGKKLSAQEIAAAFGVPMQVIPIEGSQTFANYEQARLALYEDGVLPLLDSNCDFLNGWLVPKYRTPGLRVGYDVDQVAALESKRQAKWASINTASFLTINERREALGYAPSMEPEADMLWMPAGQLPLGTETTNETAP
jgi:HK97 family phage portal protein